MNTTDDATDTTSRTTVETNNGNETHAHTTRMTVETRERSGMRRIVFYTLRALVLYCAVYGLWTDRGFYALLLGIALIVFWRVKKRMPYDYV